MRESPRHKLSKAAIKAWRVSTAFFVFLLILIPCTWLTINFFLSGVDTFPQWTIIAFAVTVLTVGALGIFFIPEIRWQRWYYDVDENEVDLQSGILIITRTLVPVERVQHVDTRQGPILRSYGLADVTISTAATTHRIPALDVETADEVRDQISKFARLAKEDV